MEAADDKTATKTVPPMKGVAPKNLLKGLKRPKVVEFHHMETKPDYGKFVAEPFEKGFGVTIGNALRRVLMSCIEGTAIVAIKIEGIDHEFSTIPGVTEDLWQDSASPG